MNDETLLTVAIIVAIVVCWFVLMTGIAVL